MNLTGIRTYLEPDLAREVSRTARAQGRSESSVIAELIRARFAATGEGAQQASDAAQKRVLARLEARMDKIHRDQALMKESLFVFVRVWLEHNPPIDEALVDSIASSAEARFERFLDLVAQGVPAGRSTANGATHVANGQDEAGLADRTP